MASKSFLDLQWKSVIVTGASAGIGEAVALEFAKQGSHLMLCGRNQARLNKVVELCRQAAPFGVMICTTVGDVVDEAVQRAIVDNTVAKLGKIDVLVNNAGILVAGGYAMSRADYIRQMSVNMDSVFFLTQYAVPHLVKTKGNIINVSSIVSERPSANVMAYSISKGAMDAYTKSLAMDLAPHGIRVNSINPGSVVSLIYRRGNNGLGDEAYSKFVAAMSSPEVHPLGRTALPSECADSVVFLASQRASFLTGQIIFVDGGRHCVGPKPRL